MQIHKKLKARILSLALSVAMVTTMMPATVFAAEGASKDVYALNAELNTPFEDLNLPAEDEPVVDSGKPSEDEVVVDGVNLPQIYVEVGKQAKVGPSITVNINNGTTAGGTTLQAVVEANGGATAVTSLEITAGKVTTADWKYLNTLYALKTFEINSAVTVDAIPHSNSSIFPSNIETVTVPQAITIGENAFWGCNALTNANFPAATTLGKMAFMGCTALASVNLPKVTSIGDFAFQQCDALTNVSFLAATTLGELVFYDSEALASASFPVLADIGDEAFAVCDELTSLNLGATPPSSVGTGAFDSGASPRALGYLKADGTALTGTDLTNAQAAYKAVAGTDSNTRDNLWYDWTIVSAEATSITVTINGVDYEGDTFQNAISKVPGGATAVTSLKITAGAVTEADWNYLKSLDSMISFEIESGVTVAAMPDTPIGSLFPPSIVSVTVPQEIAIGTRAFSGCYQLTTVNFPAVTTIYAQAFYNCYQLTSVSFPAVTEITKLAFYDSGLTSASFPVLKTIGEGAFGYCTKLTSLKLGATVPTSVATDAFSGGPETRALGYVDASGNALAGEDLATAIANYTAKADADGKWYGWTIEAAEAASITVTINGVDYEGDTFQNAISKVPGGATAVTSLKVTAGPVTENDWNYLTNLSKLSNFQIADDSAVTSVADIPNSKTANPIFPPSIVSVTVPQEIAIGKRAFNRCSALTSASFPAATTIGDNAFNSCSMLASASFPAAETIGTYAFSGCSMLATLKLGATPPTVGSNAFNNGASSRALGYVDANGDPLAGTALATAIANYKNDTTAGAVVDGKWYGWTIETVVGPAITIGTQPTSPAAMTYGSITGSLTVAGTADNSNPVSYQWYKNTTNSATGGTAVSGAITASFTIPTTLDAGTHYYYCVLKATGCPDRASDVATVTVNKANATDTMKIVAATVSKNGATGATATLPTKPAAATYGTITYGGAITCSNASVNGDTLTYTAPASTAGATGTITIPVTTATNYNDYDIVVTITSTDKKAATITAAVADKTYNGEAVTQPTPTAVEKDTTTPVTLTYSYKWQKSNESGVYTDISGNTAPKDAGSYKLVIEGSSDTHTGTTEIAFTISKATVTITADNKSAYVGDAKPTLTYTSAGLASGDTLATVPTLTYESEPDMSKAGSVKIKASNAVAPNTNNYESAITYVDGTLTITVSGTAPSIIEKPSGAWTKGSSTGLKFKSDAPYDEFIRVEVNGKEISADKYTISKGSIIVELKKSYLETLSAGTYTLGIVSKGGTATASFEIKAAGTSSDKPSSPQTGDSNGMVPWSLVMLISGICLLVTALYKKRKTMM